MGSGWRKKRSSGSTGMARLNAEGVMWTSSPGLLQLNGKRWIVEGVYDVKEESFEAMQQILSYSIIDVMAIATNIVA